VTGARARSAWQAFGTWRRSRPFWGGLLLILAGLEMIAIPLLSVVAHNSVKVVIYIGIGGIFGVLIGGLLMACGLLIWFHPVQRVFYGIAGVLLAVASFVATNLGGFFVGMLLGVTGGSLSFGWTPGDRNGQPGRADLTDLTGQAGWVGWAYPAGPAGGRRRTSRRRAWASCCAGTQGRVIIAGTATA
jgi:hypothetical protein